MSPGRTLPPEPAFCSRGPAWTSTQSAWLMLTDHVSHLPPPASEAAHHGPPLGAPQASPGCPVTWGAALGPSWVGDPPSRPPGTGCGLSACRVGLGRERWAEGRKDPADGQRRPRSPPVCPLTHSFMVFLASSEARRKSTLASSALYILCVEAKNSCLRKETGVVSKSFSIQRWFSKILKSNRNNPQRHISW